MLLPIHMLIATCHVELVIDRHVYDCDGCFTVIADITRHRIMQSTTTRACFMQVPCILEELLDRLVRKDGCTADTGRSVVDVVTRALHKKCLRTLFCCYMRMPRPEVYVATTDGCACEGRLRSVYASHPHMREVEVSFAQAIDRAYSPKVAQEVIFCCESCHRLCCMALARLARDGTGSAEEAVLRMPLLRVFPRHFLRNQAFHTIITAYGLCVRALRINYHGECHWYSQITADVPSLTTDC